MAIANLTKFENPDEFGGGLHVIGRVWKGDRKPERGAGKDLGEKMRVEIESEVWRKRFLEHYPAQPDRINIYLPYNSVDRVFDTWMEQYGAGGLKLRCDGDRIIKERSNQSYEIENKGKMETRYDGRMVAVDKPCDRFETDTPVCTKCSKAGRFFFYIQELYSAGMGSSKAFMLSTTSTYDIAGLYAQLAAIKDKYGMLSGSPIPSPITHGFIPFVLTRQKRQIYRPVLNKEYKQTGDRTKGEMHVLSIEENPQWLASLQRYMQFEEMQRLGISGDPVNALMREINQERAIASGEYPALPPANPIVQTREAIALPSTPTPGQRAAKVRTQLGLSKEQVRILASELLIGDPAKMTEEDADRLIHKMTASTEPIAVAVDF